MTGAFGDAIPRDRYGRPLIKPADGGKEVAYTRCTTFVKALDDMNNLLEWKARMTLYGAVKSPSIIKAAKVLDPAAPDFKKTAKELVEKAMTLAGAGDKASDGTTLHKLTEHIDLGTPLPDGLDEGTIADLAAYRAATAGLTMRMVEAFVVCDELKVAGTFDRLVTLPTVGLPDWLAGKTVVADLKTGSLDWSIGAIASQIATYAHSELYDQATGARMPLGADLGVGLIIHLPSGQATCTLYVVNLAAGWAATQLSGQVREWRKGAKLDKLAFRVDVPAQVAA